MLKKMQSRPFSFWFIFYTHINMAIVKKFHNINDLDWRRRKKHKPFFYATRVSLPPHFPRTWAGFDKFKDKTRGLKDTGVGRGNKSYQRIIILALKSFEDGLTLEKSFHEADKSSIIN